MTYVQNHPLVLQVVQKNYLTSNLKFGLTPGVNEASAVRKKRVRNISVDGGE